MKKYVKASEETVKYIGSMKGDEDSGPYNEFEYRDFLIDIGTEPVVSISENRNGNYLYTILYKPEDGSEPTADDILTVDYFGAKTPKLTLEKAVKYIDDYYKGE